MRHDQGRVRLQKRMAHLGVASRRESERLITAGRVMVNGHVVTELGSQVGPGDQIAVDGQAVGPRPQSLMIVLNKPTEVICTRRDPQGRRTIYDLLPADMPHLAHVGRLDFMTEGLLLLTSDGDLAQSLLLPDSAVARVYEVKVRGRVSVETVRRLERGVPLDGRQTRPIEVERIPTRSKHDWLRLTLFEGRYRHVRRVLEAVGHSVTRLRRVAFGGITIEGLREGAWREATPSEVAGLRALVRD